MSDVDKKSWEDNLPEGHMWSCELRFEDDAPGRPATPCVITSEAVFRWETSSWVEETRDSVRAFVLHAALREMSAEGQEHVQEACEQARQARYRSFESVIEKECHSDMEFAKIMQNVTREPPDVRDQALLAAAISVVPRSSLCSRRQEIELFAMLEAEEEDLSPPLQELLARCRRWRTRAEQIFARDDEEAPARKLDS